MQLDRRLKTISDLVRKGRKFADIGTDHAYLPAYLVINGTVPCAIASDLRKGPLENARETVEYYNLADKITLRLSDGLKNFNENEVDEIAVAGMGGLLISQFINETQWLKNPDIHLILQPMTHIEDVRKTLFDNGFMIDKEVVAKDGDKLYIVLSAYYYEDSAAYTQLDLIVGRLPQNDDELSKEYLHKIYDKYYKKYCALKNANKECDGLEKLVEELKKC